MKGFTLPELLLVIGLTSVIGAVVLNFNYSLLQRQALDDTSNNLKQVLRQASMYSLNQKNDESHGVKVFSDEFILFEGSAYELRNESEDEHFPYPTHISIDGISEVVFLNQTGIPIATGSIAISGREQEQEFVIYENGRIE